MGNQNGCDTTLESFIVEMLERAQTADELITLRLW